jgi:hypothetical protein
MLGTREVVFSGGLSSKKVEELCDIAYALALLEEGTKEALITLIKSNLEAHPELRQLRPSAATHTFGPTQSFGTYHYSSYTNYTPETTRNIPTPHYNLIYAAH